MRFSAFMILAAMTTLGCSNSNQANSNSANTNSAKGRVATEDVFDFELEEDLQYCRITLPFANSIAGGQYAAAYDLVDPIAFSDVHSDQLKRISQPKEFKNGQWSYAGDPNDRIGQVNKDKFIEILKTNESLGKPTVVTDVRIEDTFTKDDPCTGFIGNYPKNFPFHKVRATLTCTLDCAMDKESEANFQKQYKWEVTGDCWMSLFLMVIEDQGQLKIGYVEFRDMATEE